MEKEEKKNGAEKPVSLHPLKFEEAVADLLKVEPSGKGGGKRANKDSRKSLKGKGKEGQ